jgi:molybdenum cofactor cytidylyltransferase
MSGGGIAGVVLAAGKSERMDAGLPKQLLPFGEAAMAAVVVATAETSQLDQVVVVTGHDAAEITASLACERAIVVHNAAYEGGNVTSLRRGIAAASAPDAILLLLGDMPGVSVEIVDRFVGLWRDVAPWAAVAIYDDGVPNHPFLLSVEAVAALQATSGSKALWTLLVEDPPHPVTAVRFEQPAPIDIDTVADYDEALRRRAEDVTGQ